MATTAKNLGTNQFRITAEGTPKTYHMFMEYPVEVTECWANICERREISAGVKSGVGEILEESLFKLIGDAFLADGAAVKDLDSPSGMEPMLGALQSDSLPKIDQT
ncbi:MAG: hypothetical protein OYH77_06555 [Pseudomonadota bacterium]|nr:hypothetical protein [Pseudomonadota bacterium]